MGENTAARFGTAAIGSGLLWTRGKAFEIKAGPGAADEAGLLGGCRGCPSGENAIAARVVASDWNGSCCLSPAG